MKERNKQFPKEQVLQESVQDMRELSIDELDKVAGGGDPYANVTVNTGNSQGIGITADNHGPITLPELP